MLRFSRLNGPGRVAGAGVVLAAAAVVSGAGVAAAKPGPPVLAFTPSPYDYGQVQVGQTVSQTFTLANSGGSATSALTVTLPGSAAFTITADACTAVSLGPGKSCTVVVRFAPTGAGTGTATASATPAPATRPGPFSRLNRNISPRP